MPRDVNIVMREYGYVPQVVDLVPGETVVFHIDGVEANEFAVAVGNIDKARLVPDWAALGFAPVKPGKDKPAQGAPEKKRRPAKGKK